MFQVRALYRHAVAYKSCIENPTIVLAGNVKIRCIMGENGIFNVFWLPLREHPHMFYTPSFTLLYSRKGEMRGTQNEGLFSCPD